MRQNSRVDSAKFLTPTEKVEVQRRLAADNHELSDSFHLRYVGQALKDWKIWVNMVLTCGLFSALYSVALFLPTIIKDMGYNNNAAQLMTVPVYVFACINCISASYFADKYKQRGLFLLAYEAVGIIGFSVLASCDTPHIQYFGAFLAAAGRLLAQSLEDCEYANNV